MYEILCTSNILIPTIPTRYYCDKTCVINIICVMFSVNMCFSISTRDKCDTLDIFQEYILKHFIIHLQLPVRTVPRK